MEEKQKKQRSENLANRMLLRRTIILLVIFGVMAFIPLIGKLWNLQITQHDKLEEKAVQQQTSTLSISASRGTIYDAGGNVLAISSTAYDVIISPKAITQKQAELDKSKAEAIEKGKPYSDYDINVEDLVVTGMASILGLEESDLREKCQDTTSQYKRLATKVDADTEDQIRAYMEEHSLSGCIYLQPNTKRYYPYSTLASQIIGFTNDNGGAYGLEAKFDSDLTGTPGLVVTAQNGSGTDLLNFFQDYYDAEDGSDLHLTIDANIQTMCESMLAEAIQKYDVQEGGIIIAMSCKTGSILGMASSPTYDLNDYTTVTDSVLLQEVQEAVDEGLEEDPTADAETLYNQAYAAAINKQWRNKAINDTYEPGSTFKSLVLAAALEEGVTSPEENFYCSGSIQIYDRTINCSRTSGHGAEDLAKAVGNSCNPVFITLGQRLGQEKFMEYLEGFGILSQDGGSSSTGIDLPGEAASIFWDNFGPVELATASFGQRLQVTPIQLITAFNTVVNGGYYYQPYVVDYVENAQGDITYSADTTPLRQVISESTSELCREMLEGVVANGLTGKNAYRTGYRIGGKTGTSETLDKTDKGHYIVSFVGFAPADDPEVIVLVALDHPENEGSSATSKGSMYTSGGYYISGGNMAAPVAGDLLVNILDYLDYGTQYTSEELNGASTIVPKLTGYDLETAQEMCEEYGFTYRVEGDGDTVEAQTASGGSYIPQGNCIVLYTGGKTPPDYVTVPDLTGLTPDEASAKLAEVDLYMEATGVSKYYTDTTQAYAQSENPGDGIAPGSVITVSFVDNSETDNETDVIQ